MITDLPSGGINTYIYIYKPINKDIHENYQSLFNTFTITPKSTKFIRVFIKKGTMVLPGAL